MSDEQIWYKSNKYMAKGFLVLGVLQTVYNVGLFIFKADICSYGIAGNLAFMTIGVGGVVISSMLYLRKL